MNLLVITQKVDSSDDVLGFFHGWICALADQVEKLTVICLYEGEHKLPDNVTVFSLGKEKRESRLQYIFNFVRYIVQMRKEYTHVFVHMNQEYVLLGGLFWRLWGKRIALWRNHAKGNVLTRIAVSFSHVVFYTSPQSFTARFRKALRAPVGINVSTASESNTRKEKTILSLGRISPVKNIEVMIQALVALQERGVSYTASFYGDPTDRDQEYYQDIREQAQELEKEKVVTFFPGVSHHEVASVYLRHSIFINATPRGSFDKTILEAISHGTIPVICNTSLDAEYPKELIFEEGNSNDLSKKLETVLALPENEKERLRTFLKNKILSKHSLEKTITTISSSLAS